MGVIQCFISNLNMYIHGKQKTIENCTGLKSCYEEIQMGQSIQEWTK